MGITLWGLVRFAHVLAAIVWVGGQLTLTLIVRPVVARQTVAAESRELLSTMGRRFALVANAVVLPALLVTGVAMMFRLDIGAQVLATTTYGHMLVAKLALVVVVVGLAAGHGVLAASGRMRASRVLATASLVGSVLIVLLATSLVG